MSSTIIPLHDECLSCQNVSPPCFTTKETLGEVLKTIMISNSFRRRTRVQKGTLVDSSPSLLYHYAVIPLSPTRDSEIPSWDMNHFGSFPTCPKDMVYFEPDTDITSKQLYDTIPFEDEDGGAWKQVSNCFTKRSSPMTTCLPRHWSAWSACVYMCPARVSNQPGAEADTRCVGQSTIRVVAATRQCTFLLSD